MNLQQKAIIDQANKDGVPACERDARLVVYTMVEATRRAMAKYEVGLNKMTQIQQDAVYGDLEKEYEEMALSVARAIASGSTPSVPFTLKDMKIANGTITGLVKGTEKHFNDLISKVQDKAEVLIILYPRDYAQAMDGIQGEADQRPLSLDAEPEASTTKGKAKSTPKAESPTSAKAIAANPIDLPEKLVADAVEFVQRNQVCATAALQNHLKIATKKAEAVQLKLAELGHIALDEQGVYQIVRDKPVDDSADKPQELTPELYESIKAKVITDQRVSVGALIVAFGIEPDLAENAIFWLEEAGIVSPEDEETGAREVLVDAA